MKFLYFDTEYNNTTEKHLNVICFSFLVDNKVTNFWLNGVDDYQEIHTFINHYKDRIFVSFNVEAEAQALISIGVDPLSFKWVDLYLEYRQLLNHNHKLQYGKQLLKGRKVTTKAPDGKWNNRETSTNDENRSKPSYSLASACYKLLGILIDCERKDLMRDIIIFDRDIEGNKKEILEYCDSDVEHLPNLFKRIKEEYEALPYKPNLEILIKRAEYSARTAKMVSLGYPVNTKAVTNFSESVADILWKVQNEINTLFPDIKPFTKKKDRTYSWNQNATRLWISSQGHTSWLLTDTGKLSLSLEAFQKKYPTRHSYSKTCLGEQFVRYLKLKQQLNGFSPSSKNKFTDYLGTDGRVRPYFNIFGSQSGRSQPKATGFLFLKSAWMRALCQPVKGRVIGSIDYKSQEFILAAMMSGDRVMVDAYLSGDPYLFFAKQARAVPPSGTKKEYKKERDLFKSTTLGLSYDMSKYGLAAKLTKDLGHRVSEEDAQKMIDRFYRLYKRYKFWKKTILNEYNEKGYLVLKDGWCMYGDNKNLRSVGNFPVQGMGAVVMRKAVALSQDRGLDIILTLHDALYCEFDLGDYKEGMITLGKCMQEAFKFYSEDQSINIGLDANVWGPDLQNGYYDCDYLGQVKQQDIYVDDRSIEEYQTFKEYFTDREFDL